MDYVSPAEVISDAVKAAEKKAGLSIGDLLIRGALAGVFLGFATSLAFTSVTQGSAGYRGRDYIPRRLRHAGASRAGTGDGELRLVADCADGRADRDGQACCATGPGFTWAI